MCVQGGRAAQPRENFGEISGAMKFGWGHTVNGRGSKCLFGWVFNRLLIPVGKHHFKLLWFISFLNHSECQQGTHGVPGGWVGVTPLPKALTAVHKAVCHTCSRGHGTGEWEQRFKGLKGFPLVRLQRTRKVIKD